MLKLIPKREAADRRGVHPNHLMRLVGEGKFPQPWRDGAGHCARVYFVEQEVDDHLEGLAASRFKNSENSGPDREDASVAPTESAHADAGSS
ncbi:MAG: helix-turn-helix domain-containing protein [Alphaproteobacteria bacterium]|nr:helix-turn-helix domain-containing protein [Alphaproteobacteria bacterium]